jgi:hypothetical protein
VYYPSPSNNQLTLDCYAGSAKEDAALLRHFEHAILLLCVAFFELYRSVRVILTTCFADPHCRASITQSSRAYSRGVRELVDW